MTTLEKIEKDWEEAYGLGTPKERVDRAKAWLPYYAYLAAGAADKPFDADADPTGFVTFLISSGRLRPEDTVLDIGAGRGDYSLRLARHCRRVTALDLDPESLSVLRRRAAAAGIGNVGTVTAPWEFYTAQAPFDVTFTAMCQAVSGVPEILRMEGLTGRLCALVTVRKGSFDKHRKAMMAELGLHPKGMLADADRYLAVLRAMGRDVTVQETVLRSESDIPAETVLERYPIYFSVFGLGRSESSAFLKDYLDRHAENGVLHDESELRFSLLTWKPGTSSN